MTNSSGKARADSSAEASAHQSRPCGGRTRGPEAEPPSGCEARTDQFRELHNDPNHIRQEPSQSRARLGFRRPLRMVQGLKANRGDPRSASMRRAGATYAAGVSNMTTPTLSDLRARVLAGDVLTDDEILHVVRALRDQRAGALRQAAEKAASKHVDYDTLFAGGGVQSKMKQDPFR